MSGVLFIISSPIGNLEDISLRAKRIISEVDFLLVEDTRVTIKLLNHLQLKKPMISCHKFNEAERKSILKEANEKGQKIALISDAGTPLISDPGQRMVDEALALNMELVVIPGPTACIQALVGSGLPCDKFVFEGFLPEKAGAMRTRLKELAKEERTLIFYVSCHSLKSTIDVMLETLGERRVCLARELTKRFEEYIRVPLSKLLAHLTEEKLRGEFTLIVEGAEPVIQEAFDFAAAKKHVLVRLETGATSKEIVSELVDRFGMRKSESYDFVLNVKKETQA